MWFISIYAAKISKLKVIAFEPSLNCQHREIYINKLLDKFLMKKINSNFRENDFKNRSNVIGVKFDHEINLLKEK